MKKMLEKFNKNNGYVPGRSSFCILCFIRVANIYYLYIKHFFYYKSLIVSGSNIIFIVVYQVI